MAQAVGAHEPYSVLRTFPEEEARWTRPLASRALALALAAGATGLAHAGWTPRDTKPPTAPANLRVTAASQTTAQVTGLHPSTSYTFKAQACSAARSTV